MPEVPPPVDYSDPEIVAALRAEVHPLWAEAVGGLDRSWTSRREEHGGVPCVRFAANEGELDQDRVIVHIHGGAFILGSPEANAAISVPVALNAGFPVVSVDYRLAPEHRCPAAVVDCVAVVESLTGVGEVVGMFGESAGGGLSLATAVALRDSASRLPGRIGLISPWLDLTCSGDTHATLLAVDPDFPHPDDLSTAGAAYAADPRDPQASPLFADLHGLPPILIQVGGREVLLSDSLRVDRVIRGAGGSSTLDVWDGLWHVWHQMVDLPEAQQAQAELAAFLVGR